MPAQGRGANLKPSQVKAAPKAPPKPPKSIVATKQNAAFGPVIGKKGPLVSSQATRPSAPGTKGAPGKHALVSLHTLKEAAGGARATVGAVPFTPFSRITAGALAKPIATKALATGKVAAKEPGQLAGRTIKEIPADLNAMLTGTGRTILQTGAELAATTPTGRLAEKKLGIKAGIPGEAVGEFAKGIASEYVGSKARYGKSLKAEEAELKKRGIVPEATDLSMALGPAFHGAGVAHAEALRTSGVGLGDLAKVKEYRDAVTHAYQAPDVQTFLARKDQIPQKPTPGEFKRAAKRESLEPRPHLRTASGREPVSHKRGAAVRYQHRSPNYYVARRQTAIDDARRRYVQEHLQKVMQARLTAEEHPNVPGAALPQPYASQLAYDLRRGEVAPRFQPGGKASGRFIGAERQQHIGQAYAKGQNVRGRRAIVDPYTQDFHKQLRGATKQQKAILVHAKEGMLNLEDPVKATQDLQEIHDQALEGRHEMTLPIQHIAKGADVARETGAVLDHIAKHGPESVFTPKFKHLVETIPDERLVSQMSPWVQQNPDQAIARKYLPQVQHLEQWALRHPDHPDAAWTLNATKQIHHLLEEGFDLRKDGKHDAATDKYATAKNLADEIAKHHGKPTDRAYVAHTKTHEPEHYLHTVSNVAPADVKQWHGVLQRLGTRSTDPELVVRAIAKAVREHFSLANVKAYEERFGVKLPRNDMTGKEVHEWLAKSGRNPAHYEVQHLGRLRQELMDRGEAEHLIHLDSDPEAHARAEAEMWERAGKVSKSDMTKGASLVNKAAANEMRKSFKSSGAAARMAGKLKGGLSKYMLGFSLPWLTTMSAFTYPIQGLMAGATPADLAAAMKYYRPLSRIEKAQFDEKFGVDSPYQISSHGLGTEKLASAMPDRFKGLAETMHRAAESPTAKILIKANPLKAFADAVLKTERVPRRYSRISAAMKGIKTVAIKEMVDQMHEGQLAHNRFETKTQQLLHSGRMPKAEFIKKALENTKEMEKLAQHLDRAMGEWKEMTAFERNNLNKVVMFYPWLRYSLRLVAHTLPVHHPLMYSLGLKLGTWQQKELTELLGTTPSTGVVYLGKAQPNVPPEKRQFAEMNIKQANPTLNTALATVAGSPSELFDVLPPYMTSALSWAVGKSLFTDKPFKGSKEGESQEVKGGRPGFVGYMLHENVEEPFGPARFAGKFISRDRPQSAESAPLFGMEKPVKYSRGFERKLSKEKEKKESFWEAMLHELVPALPHPSTKLPLKIKYEKKEAKEEKKKARKEYARKHPYKGGGGGLPELPATPEGSELPALP